MSDDPEDHGPSYPEQLADAALRRAAQLQSEAAERIERKALVRASDNHLTRAELIVVAREAGIAEEYLALALSEVEGSPGTDGSLPALVVESEPAVMTRWLGSRHRSLSAARQIPASADAVLRLLPDVFEADEFRLRFAGFEQAELIRGGVLRFEMAKLGDMVTRTGGYTPLCYRLTQLEMWTLKVTIHELGPTSCEVVVYGDLRQGSAANVRAAKGFTAGLGVVAVGVATAISIASGLGALTLIPALVAGASSGGLTMLGYRSTYQSVLRYTLVDFEHLLDAVERRAQRASLAIQSA